MGHAPDAPERVRSAPVTRPAHRPRPLTIAEAAEYLGYRTTAGVRGLVKKQLLRPCGRGARDQHLFELAELDRYTRDRGLAYDARRVECRPKLGHSSPCREASGAPGGDVHYAPGEGDEAEELRRGLSSYERRRRR